MIMMPEQLAEIRARCEALEQAVKHSDSNCDLCIHYSVSTEEEPCIDCFLIDDKHWQFDEARFTKKESDLSDR